MKKVWLIIAALSPLLSFSQESSSGTRFHTFASVGMASGESAVKPLFQLASGLSFDRWFTGIGIGLDYYNLKSVPLFADCRVNFGKTRSGFLYAQGGYNFSFGNKSGDFDFFKTTDHFSGGFYMDAGLGYRIRLGSSHRLLFSAGYSQKNIFNKMGYTYPCPSGTCPEVIYDYHYSFGRIVTKLSWEFGK